MQFADSSSTIKYESFGYYYGDVMYLVDFINNPRPKICSPSFKDKMEISRHYFPLFHAYCEEINPQLHTMSKKNRLELKLKLLEELKDKMEKTKQDIAAEKWMKDVRLPNDTGECHMALHEMINKGLDDNEDFQQYQAKTELCRTAMKILNLMEVDKDQFVIFNEKLFTSLPTRGMRRSKRAGK